MGVPWGAFPQPLLEFWTQRHLCTLTTLRADGRPHVVPVGVVLDHDQRCAWVITRRTSVKARHLATLAPVAACQVDGGRWSTIEGHGVVAADADSVARAVELYAARYRQPKPNPERVALRIEVDRVLSSSAFT
ncbi:MAG TPA: acyltransferase [Nocardioides bacterium]|uniref:pyridoxamine 5'-phosphate oxidase family protein n=1 Tax=uncultured Nocardioides sp. TaxID=198441 RepID=UPI000EE2E3CE|nr:TIGR03618 family F420-dependent PPOX class oxidoreductase [uncultured Nocardioides sp.]HCB03231.1 acyltransferase [Nocardioides sp.]